MRAMMRIALATTALAVGGLLTVGVSDTAFAKTKHVTHHKKTTPSAAAVNDPNAPNPGSNAPTRRTVARDRVANPGRGDPGKTPQKATDQPF